MTVFDVVIQLTLERTASYFGAFFPFLLLPFMDFMLALLIEPLDTLDPLDFLDLLPANVSDALYEDENLLKVSYSPWAATEVDKASRNTSRNAIDNLMFFVCVFLLACEGRKRNVSAKKNQ